MWITNHIINVDRFSVWKTFKPKFVDNVDNFVFFCYYNGKFLLIDCELCVELVFMLLN